ncbi:MAG: hypothetical protein VX542_03850 [Cyanobacteriota bacterium]|nr:hypothetical protein [Cyanobacteriota bacterium]
MACNGSQSPKKLRGVMRLAAEMGIKWHQLHYLFEVRFVESDWRAIRAFLQDYSVIVADLTEALLVAVRSSGVGGRPRPIRINGR